MWCEFKGKYRCRQVRSWRQWKKTKALQAWTPGSEGRLSQWLELAQRWCQRCRPSGVTKLRTCFSSYWLQKCITISFFDSKHPNSRCRGFRLVPPSWRNWVWNNCLSLTVIFTFFFFFQQSVAPHGTIDLEVLSFQSGPFSCQVIRHYLDVLLSKSMSESAIISTLDLASLPTVTISSCLTRIVMIH